MYTKSLVFLIGFLPNFLQKPLSMLGIDIFTCFYRNWSLIGFIYNFDQKENNMTKPRPIWDYVNPSSTGQKRRFESAEQLWDKACEYFRYASTRKITQQQWVGKDGKEVLREVDAPFLPEAFSLFCGVSSSTFRKIRDKHKNLSEDHKDYEYYKEMSSTITLIEDVIFTQNYEQAVGGNYNPMLVARKLGLRERTDVTSNDQEIKQLGSITVELPDGVSLNAHQPGQIEEAKVVKDQENDGKIRKLG